MFRSFAFLVLFAIPAAAQPAFTPVQSLAKVSAAPSSVWVVQCNPYIGGKHPINGDKDKVTWETCEQFAKELKARCPQATVVGEEEVIGLESAERMKTYLTKHTGKQWDYVFDEQGVNDRGSGIAIHYRTDKIQVVKRLGKVEIDRIDNGYVLRFGGALLAEKSSGRQFAVFAGKIIWSGAIKDGKKVDEKIRVAEAKRLKDWVRQVMAPYPNVPRIVTMDQNSPYGGPTFDELAKEWENDGSRDHTHSSQVRVLGFSIMTKRLDYIWYDADGGAKKKGGFVSKAGRSEHFGSDHRAVWAEVRI